MDKVLLRQFETYLQARGIKPEAAVTKAPVTQSSTGKRRKRSTEKLISGTLPPEKVWRACPIVMSFLFLSKRNYDVFLIFSSTFSNYS